MKALLIIDVQNDFLPPNGTLAVPHGDEIVHPILELIHDEKQDWHRVVMTRDWHPKNHISFAKRHNQEPYSKITYKSPKPGDKTTQEGVLWPVHCIQNTRGSQLADPLLKETYKNHYKIVDKGFLSDREYYSAFHDIWNFHKTELHEYLQKHHITEVYIVGLALDYCVKETAISAAKLGYKTTILKDYTKPVNSDDESMMKLKEEFNSYNIKLD
ncbi:nicotinamidase NDAI_0D03800 [Naumovozyma dairenensis CBS 421]|uniref:nicotinamidase n=1 Tax=Naumovozyma dairenensis (strain ATCC 10597 / BCRC 20456 / CBS 421 / NBRC 0211 / NRRL Y-12639) TaxID=1071378 RepID=G0WA83_NAUDC|nr:hypothetical protein NDAI_0D03800 [Naumovozyma dairenensis CBS 421]CCD24694.1 hypothetical protein NDAI_0D03800 [Naumovozyma dairenensis CBS 421]